MGMKGTSAGVSMGVHGKSLLLAIILLPSFARAEDAGVLPTPTATVTPASKQADRELDSLLARVVDIKSTYEMRKSAAKEVRELGSESVPAIARKLAENRKVQTPGVFATMKMVREENEGHLQDANFDLGDAVLRLRKQDGPGYKTVASTAVLMQALLRIHSTPALRELVMLVGDHEHVYRPEVTRQRKRGRRAIHPGAYRGAKGSVRGSKVFARRARADGKEDR